MLNRTTLPSTGRGRMRSFRAALGAIAITQLLAACVISTPYEAVTPKTAAQADPILIVITEATLGPDRKARDAFWDGVQGVRDSLPDQPGLIGYSVRRELFGDRVWTMTEWRSEADLDAFISSPAHQRAMNLGVEATVRIRFARLTRRADERPVSWARAETAVESGREYE